MTIDSLLRRNVFIPLWVSKNRSPRLSYLRGMERSQYLSSDALRRESFRRLREVLAHAYGQTEYYRKAFDTAGVHPRDVQRTGDLKAVPLLTKEELRQHGSSMIARGSDGGRLLPFKTGGSTGSP